MAEKEFNDIDDDKDLILIQMKKWQLHYVSDQLYKIDLTPQFSDIGRVFDGKASEIKGIYEGANILWNARNETALVTDFEITLDDLMVLKAIHSDPKLKESVYSLLKLDGRFSR